MIELKLNDNKHTRIFFFPLKMVALHTNKKKKKLIIINKVTQINNKNKLQQLTIITKTINKTQQQSHIN